ncbi:MAG TPA: oxidoreductase [Verrucomicrobia bacterium]|nr:MAG: oxidoreductase [Lentisphaerae bacterium GWF2_57_35]HBA84287.1 oxidoreductase [Verrucomicrobiota bacterium]
MRDIMADLKQAKVLVTGATGFTGAVLVRKLIEAGAEVRAVARATSKTEALAGLPIQWIRGEVFDEETVRQAVDGVEYIFHVAAAYREAGIGDDVYWKVHVQSTQLLAQAAVRNSSFKRFVHVSTVGVHGHIENPPADENYPFHPGDVYQKTKAEAELWLRDFAAKSGLKFAVIRPAAIYGDGDRRLLKVFKMAAWPVFPLLGRGKCLYHLIHVEDLARMMMLAAVHPAAENEVFICGNPSAVTLEEMGRTIAKTLGCPFRSVRIPAWPFFLAADVCEKICRPLGVEPPIYRRRVAFFTKDRSFDTRKIREKLGYDYLYANESGLEKTARDYVARGWLKAKPS